MRRMLLFALVGLLGLAAQSQAQCLSCGLGLDLGLRNGCCPCCKPIPCQECCDCGCPCDRRMHLNICDKSAEYVCKLQSGATCCDRIAAAKKLGSRLHADFCCDPCVVPALLGALQCDPCWEVRQAAAWSLMLQGARTEDVVLALYVSSKADNHYMVRSTAAEALDILTVCCKPCYVELIKVGDAIVKELKAKKYKPGMENCCFVVTEAFVAGREARAKAAVEEANKASLPPGATLVAPTQQRPAGPLPPNRQ